jgi:DnaJ-class molecular chaperone
MKVCPHCNGRGWVNDGEDCPDCNGSGQVGDDEEEPAQIPEPDGDGLKEQMMFPRPPKTK